MYSEYIAAASFFNVTVNIVPAVKVQAQNARLYLQKYNEFVWNNILLVI